MALRRLRKDDTVMVIAGRERGKTGKVLRVLPERDRVVIERINLVKRHTKPRGTQQGGIIEKEAPLHLDERIARHVGEGRVLIHAVVDDHALIEATLQSVNVRQERPEDRAVQAMTTAEPAYPR